MLGALQRYCAFHSTVWIEGNRSHSTSEESAPSLPTANGKDREVRATARAAAALREVM